LRPLNRRWYAASQLRLFTNRLLLPISQGVTKRAGRKKNAEADFATAGASSGGAGGKSSKKNVGKAVFEAKKKTDVGVSDLTLISKITDEEINQNLMKRFQAKSIYVRTVAIRRGGWEVGEADEGTIDIHRTCVNLC
jgi:hypothetical protein